MSLLFAWGCWLGAGDEECGGAEPVTVDVIEVIVPAGRSSRQCRRRRWREGEVVVVVCGRKATAGAKAQSLATQRSSRA